MLDGPIVTRVPRALSALCELLVAKIARMPAATGQREPFSSESDRDLNTGTKLRRLRVFELRLDLFRELEPLLRDQFVSLTDRAGRRSGEIRGVFRQSPVMGGSLFRRQAGDIGHGFAAFERSRSGKSRPFGRHAATAVPAILTANRPVSQALRLTSRN